ncbi:unnamed protein product [Caenorhabditis nigoni]
MHKEEQPEDVTDYEDAKEQVVTDYEDAEEESDRQEPEALEAPEPADKPEEKSPQRKFPLRTTSNILASPPRPAKRSLVQEVQAPAPIRRCPFTRPDHQPHCYPDPSKIGTLAGMFNNRSKIRLPGATYIIEHVDRKMQVHIPWCTPIVPAKVPVEKIVNDFMIDQGHIRCNQTVTTPQLAQLAPGIAELVKILNLNICWRTTIQDLWSDPFDEKNMDRKWFEESEQMEMLKMLKSQPATEELISPDIFSLLFVSF